mmetsp:Transcript_20754/g.60372  ORF Transcript_20754/g.60372 Transcript_20754/m.60372 type:complete len:204 (-) Transcript_20754:3365-3976(-)
MFVREPCVIIEDKNVDMRDSTARIAGFPSTGSSSDTFSSNSSSPSSASSGPAAQAALTASNRAKWIGFVSCIVPERILLANMLDFLKSTKTPTSTRRSLFPTRRATHRTSTAKTSAYGIPSISTVISKMHLSSPSTLQYWVCVTPATGGPTYKWVVLVNLNVTTRLWGNLSPLHLFSKPVSPSANSQSPTFTSWLFFSTKNGA